MLTSHTINFNHTDYHATRYTFIYLYIHAYESWTTKVSQGLFIRSDILTGKRHASQLSLCICTEIDETEHVKGKTKKLQGMFQQYFRDFEQFTSTHIDYFQETLVF